MQESKGKNVKCKICGHEMALIYTDDTGTNGCKHDGNDYAFNVYCCDHCKALAKENVWDASGILWIHADNITELEETENENSDI